LLIKDGENIGSEQIKMIADRLYTSAYSTYNLLEDLLEWSKTQSNKIDFEPVIIELKPIYEEVMFNFSSNSKDIKFYYLPSKKIDIIVDLNMFKTILRNLISNAIKFTNKNGIINLNAERNDNNVMITVSDNGIGIKKEDLIKLFDLTQKISSNGTDNEKGTGLGLIICKELVEKHGGRIWVESEMGKGTTIKFTIPVPL
jgi:signal transduction histidine kinase